MVRQVHSLPWPAGCPGCFSAWRCSLAQWWLAGSGAWPTVSPRSAPPMKRPLLVLDLDETLIYASESPLDRSADFVVAPYHVYERPGVGDFIAHVSRHFSLGVWSSSSPAYAAAICGHLFGCGDRLEFVWASDRCTPTRDLENDSWSQSKRLAKLKRRGFRLERVLMVDDSPEKHTKNYGNLVQVRPFEGDLSDQELPLLAVYLESLAEVPNVRAVEKRRWREHALRQISSGAD